MVDILTFVIHYGFLIKKFHLLESECQLLKFHNTERKGIFQDLFWTRLLSFHSRIIKIALVFCLVSSKFQAKHSIKCVQK